MELHASSWAMTRGSANSCVDSSWWPVSTTLHLCPCCRTGHLGWHPEPRAGLQVSHRHCSLGSMQQAEERCMAEPGSSSRDWEHNGRVFGCLGNWIPGGDWALGSGIVAVRDDGACCHRAEKDTVNWSEIFKGWSDMEKIRWSPMVPQHQGNQVPWFLSVQQERRAGWSPSQVVLPVPLELLTVLGLMLLTLPW